MDNLRVSNANPGMDINAAGKNHGNAVKQSTFGDALFRAAAAAETTGLKFSKHASARINSREVDLTPEQLKRVENGVNAAMVKGVSDSLVLVDGYALIVNTRSKTVVTALDRNQNNQGNNVFTNINGAVIV